MLFADDVVIAGLATIQNCLCGSIDKILLNPGAGIPLVQKKGGFNQPACRQ